MFAKNNLYCNIILISIIYRIAFVIIILSKKTIAKRSCVNARTESRSSLERS